MTTEEFKKYLIKYFAEKEKNRLYKENYSNKVRIIQIFHKENDKHEYYRRIWGPSRPKNQ